MKIIPAKEYVNDPHAKQARDRMLKVTEEDELRKKRTVCIKCIYHSGHADNVQRMSCDWMKYNEGMRPYSFMDCPGY